MTGTLKVLDLFSGIGGFSLGLERAGMETVAFCEIEDYPCKVLAKHWPEVPIYNDVREVTGEQLRTDGITVDVITGGFPCQDISVAGKQAGIEGERSGLWSEVARLIDEIQPRYAIMENVTALISGDRGRWFGRVLGDLAEIGYDAEWHCIPASELGAHHQRDRVWIVAYPNASSSMERTKQKRQLERSENDSRVCTSQPTSPFKDELLADPDSPQRERVRQPIGILAKYADFSRPSLWKAEPDVGRVANGVPSRSHRLKALGNAVVPQIPELIGRAIMAHYKEKTL
jgi:DNA (cytosine-5)-methyltransferase 1